MARHRVYWTETTSCWMEIEDDKIFADMKTAERIARHICDLEDYKTEVHRTEPRINSDSFYACTVKDK